MTKKNRLADILEDLDEVDDAIIEDRVAHTTSAPPGEGFSLDRVSLCAMDEIDKKLESLVGKEEYQSVLMPPSNISFDSLQLFSLTHDLNTHINEIGEKALQEAKEHRDQQRRLADIEKELISLSTAAQLEMESPSLTGQQLHALLDQCRHTMSRAALETDSLSQSNSPRDVIISTQPCLDDAVLKSLLDQARAEGIVSRSERTSTQPDDNSSAVRQSGESYP
ncbi:FSIP1 [Bugula neritina]|uniref:Fibrous sheath-interacting protein 1 n=1 Tax=Bugula neritina TaxID=10212 RepID=A0A7J7JG33_BUGNE|nr:FSIP1 [Bugula neritina]